MKTLTLFTAIILATLAATAQIIHVPADQPTIQEGIDAASDGDTVLVAEGTYLENINFNGMAITVASHFILDGDTSHISNTVIDGSQPVIPDLGSVVTFDSSEDTTSILCGFTITGGTGTLVPGYNVVSGGGIQCYPAGAKIIHNIIENNSVITTGDAYGGGVLCDHEDESWLVLKYNTIRNNQCDGQGQSFGAAVNVLGNARIENNKVMDNFASSIEGTGGGGIYCQGDFYDPSPKELLLSNNIIDNNIANSQSANPEGAYAGGLFVRGYFGIVRNNTITDNSVRVYDGQQCHAPGFMLKRNSNDLIVESNIIQGNYFTNGECVGGGICIWMGGGVYQNNVIQNNQASSGGGISVFYNNSDSLAIIINNTITENEADYGGGLYMYLADAVVINTVLWDNEAFVEGEEILENESNLEVRHSNIKGEEEWPGEGNMNVDPEFRNDGYHLYFPSLLVNEGKSTIQINGEWYDAPEYDIDGDERPFDGTYPDIGADEAQWLYTSIDESTSTESSLLNVFPNPFSQSTTLAYELKKSGYIRLSIYNHLGKQVEDILEKYQSQGKYQVGWNSESLPAGVYYCMLKTENGIQTTKMIKMK